MRWTGVILSFGLGVLSACTTAHTIAQSSLNGQLALTGGTFTRVGGGVTVATELQEIAGNTAVCGVWAKTPNLHPWVRTSPGMQLLPSGAVYLNGARLLTNLSFLKEVKPKPNDMGYAGMVGNCAVSQQPWQAAYAQMVPDVRIPDQSVFKELNDEGGGFVVMFEQTGPGA